MTRSTITRLVLAAVLAIAAGAVVPRAFNPQPDPPGSQMFGITPDQTARLNVVNMGDCKVPNGFPPDPCRVQVELSFADAAGNVVARDTKTVDPGKVAFFDVQGASLFMTADSPVRRAQLRAAVHVVPAARDTSPTVVPTVEVFDSFGIDAGKARMGIHLNHNATLLRDEE